jgi:HK97 gp10 family phage protein
MSTTNIKGLRELQAFLQQLPAKVESNIMRGAMRAGAKVLLDDARENVPVEHGDLQRSLRISTSSRRGRVASRVKTDYYTARWVEYGTLHHLIKVRAEDKPTRNTRHGLKAYSMKSINKMIARGSLVIGGHFVGPVVKHPGAKAHPYLRPALDTKSGAAVVAAGNYVKSRLNKAGIDTADTAIEAD